MLVYVKESLVPDVPPSLVDADTVATGIMGIMVRSRFNAENKAQDLVEIFLTFVVCSLSQDCSRETTLFCHICEFHLFFNQVSFKLVCVCFTG